MILVMRVKDLIEWNSLLPHSPMTGKSLLGVKCYCDLKASLVKADVLNYVNLPE